MSVAGAFLLAWVISGHGALDSQAELAAFAITLLLWLLTAVLHGLYERDEGRLEQPTTDELASSFHLITTGTWLLLGASVLLGVKRPAVGMLMVFWGLGLCLMPVGRAGARAACRRRPAFKQRTVVVGTADYVQLVARKLIRHSEYGTDVVGFVDDHPRARRSDLPEDLAILGGRRELIDIIERLEVERVLISLSSWQPNELRDMLRTLHGLDVQIDLGSPALEILGPRALLHVVEGLTLLGLPPARRPYVSRVLKRAVDVGAAGAILLALAPLLAFIAIRIRLDSSGPILFRQTRLGVNMNEFTMLKFRTMRLGTDTTDHREYIRKAMCEEPAVGVEGIFKLDRSESITRVGNWLRRSSLDELPQLFNVLRGDMSLVGPRPCIPYEVEHFEPYQFERFKVPQGITGFWQVTARATSTYGEALDMDVAYVRGWSLGLDLRLLLRTPFAVLRQRQWTA